MVLAVRVVPNRKGKLISNFLWSFAIAIIISLLAIGLIWGSPVDSLQKGLGDTGETLEEFKGDIRGVNTSDEVSDSYEVDWKVVYAQEEGNELYVRAKVENKGESPKTFHVSLENINDDLACSTYHEIPGGEGQFYELSTGSWVPHFGDCNTGNWNCGDFPGGKAIFWLWDESEDKIAKKELDFAKADIDCGN